MSSQNHSRRSRFDDTLDFNGLANGKAAVPFAEQHEQLVRVVGFCW